MGRGEADRTERDSKRVFFYVGIACGIAISASLSSGMSGGLFVLSHRPLVGALISGGVLLVALGLALHEREPLGVLGPIALIPMVIGTTVNRAAGHPLVWAQALRASSVVLVFSIAIGAALFHSRKFRELERLLFTEATSAAFFVTVVAAAAYGLVEEFTKLPRLSVVWVAVFGLFSWVVLAWIFGRRYS